MDKPLRVLSLGAGVQSTTLALLAAHGLIEVPDCAIFADTGWEPGEVYAHLAWLEGVLPYPVYRVSRGNLRETVVSGRFEPIPWHRAGGPGPRQCTYQYKLRPIHRKVRELLGVVRPRPGACEMWLGISRDEAQRMKPSRVRYIENRWPLVEAGLTRAECRRYLEKLKVSAPRSACCGCPFLSNEDWRGRRGKPEWQDTVLLSWRLAARGSFMHASLKPLDQVDFGVDDRQLDMFTNECEGVCGV